MHTTLPPSVLKIDGDSPLAGLPEMQLLTLDDLASLLRTSVPGIRKLMKAGGFPVPLKRGTKWTRFRASDVAAWIDSQAKAEGAGHA